MMRHDESCAGGDGTKKKKTRSLFNFASSSKQDSPAQHCPTDCHKRQPTQCPVVTSYATTLGKGTAGHTRSSGGGGSVCVCLCVDSLELRRIMALRQTNSSLCSLSSLTLDVAATSMSKISAKPWTQLPSSLPHKYNRCYFLFGTAKFHG